MKKLILSILTTLMVSLMAFPAFGATTGTLTLQGVINEILSITVTADPVASSLDLESTQVDLVVGTVSEISNADAGYQVTVSSLNDGNLVRSGGSETFTYTLKYGGSSVDLAGSSSAPVQATSVTTGGPSTIDNEVSISYTGVATGSMTAGLYQDTLTFEIAAY